MIKKINITIVFIIILSGNIADFCFSQEKSTFSGFLFGDLQRSGASVVSFEQSKSGKILCVQKKKSLLSFGKTKYSLGLIEELSLPKFNPKKFRGTQNKSRLIAYMPLGENILALSYNNSFISSKSGLYYHFLQPQLKGGKEFGTAVNIFDPKLKSSDLTHFFLVNNANFNYASVLYFPPAKSNEHTQLKYLIFNEDLSPPTINEFLLPYPSSGFKPLNYIVFNKSEQLLITGHYPESTSNLTRRRIIGNPYYYTHTYFKYLTIYKIVNNEFTATDISSQGYFFSDIRSRQESNKTIISGLYLSEINLQIQGVFFAAVNERGEVQDFKLSGFTSNLQTQIQNAGFGRSSIPPESGKYEMIDFQKLDSGYISIAEFNAVEQRYGGADMPGSISVVNTYYWSGSLIVSKFDNSGKMIWSRIIPKIQKTVNDGGYYLSTATYIDNNKLYMFFNDNINNYDKNGDYEKEDEPYHARFGSANNTIGYVRIDINTGEIMRKKSIGKSETKVLLVPKISIPDYINKKLILYGNNGRKQRIGNVYF